MDPELQAKVLEFIMSRYEIVDPTKQQTVV
jgi:hypothetical protein